MMMNLVYGLVTMGLCLFLQSLLLVVVIRYYSSHQYLLQRQTFMSSLILVNGVMVILFSGNLAQIAVWAWLFQLLGEFDHFVEAYYHSAVNFATLGYGDIVMSEKHRLLGPIEAVNGVLMIGVSTAALLSVFQNILKERKVIAQ